MLIASPLLHFDDVHYTYTGSQAAALKGLTLTIPAGTKSVILGQNGCGKSTALFLADGLYVADRGSISWKTEPLKHDRTTLNRWRQRIGLAFQDPEQQLVAGTVAEDISYGLCNLQLTLPEIERRTEQAIADFHLQDLRDRPLHHLSLGQKRRVALAGVMALKPELLLLDEPTAYLDSIQTRTLLTELARIHQMGTTIVMATHDVNLAYEWADWLFVMHDGRLVLEGDPWTVFQHYEQLAWLQLDLPLLWQVWQAFPETWRLQRVAPRSLSELQAQLHRFKADFNCMEPSPDLPIDPPAANRGLFI